MASEDFRQTATVVPSPTPYDKAGLRSAMRARRRAFASALGGSERQALELKLAEALAPLLAGAATIAGYQPLASEISPLEALERARASGKAVALPSIAARGSAMQFRAGPATSDGPWGVPQPGPEWPVVEPDVVLVPLVAIDRQGNRVGQGQGHYDRALGELREAGARLVGIGWSFQLVDQQIAADPWDVPLDAFASPDGLIGLGR